MVRCPLRGLQRSPIEPRPWPDRGLARSDIVSFAALGLSLLVVAVPAVWVSRVRMSAVSSLSPLLPRRDEVERPTGQPPEVRRLQLEVVRLEDRIRILEKELANAKEFGRHASAADLDLGRFIECTVIGHAVNWQEKSFLIDRGARDGVVVRAGCLAGGAVAGTVVEVGPRAARVAMLGEPGVRVAGRTVEARRTGLAMGAGGGCELKYVQRWSPSLRRPRSGEAVVTSGRLGFFPAGFLIGRVASVGETAESLHLNIAIMPGIEEPPQGRVWILRPLPRDVGGGREEEQ